MSSSLLKRFEGLERLKREREIRRITGVDVGYRQQDYIDLFKICNAIWIYDGNPQGPHALLTSGRHSNGYADCSQILKFTNLRDILAERMVEEILLPNIAGVKADYIISSSMAAIPFGDGIASYLGLTFLYTEKIDGVQKMKRFEVPSKARILQVEELITTMGTTRQVTNAILEKNKNVEFVRDQNGKIVVLTLVHRPEKLPIEYPDYRILPLVELEIHNWTPEECPLCKAGSRALKPKENRKLFFKI